jgi:7-carboxy-7-deazaguanine synthase
MIISEIFRSIQGEGTEQGRPCTFIRLAGCNLSCRWCDTRYSQQGGRSLTIEELISVLPHVKGKYACITGGEPLLQRDELAHLAERLWREGYRIDIETNGTIDFAPVQPYASICMDVKCPSSGEESDLSLLSGIRSEDSVKFVVNDEEDCLYAEEVLEKYNIRGSIFFSPVNGSDYQSIACFVQEHDLPVRYQLQLHRLLGVP